MIRLAPDLALPPDAVTQAIAILGLRGSGKTHTAAVLAGRSTRSSAFNAAMAELFRAGLIAPAGGLYDLTAPGTREAGTPAPAGNLVEVWRRALPDYERALLDALLAHGGSGTRDQLAEWSGRSTSSSAFNAAISTLAKNGLVRAGLGRVAVTELLAGCDA